MDNVSGSPNVDVPKLNTGEDVEQLIQRIGLLERGDEKLRTRISELETENRNLANENDQLVKRNFTSRSSSSFSIGTWIPAELNIPSETTNTVAIRYDPKQSILKVQNVQKLRQGKHRSKHYSIS